MFTIRLCGESNDTRADHVSGGPVLASFGFYTTPSEVSVAVPSSNLSDGLLAALKNNGYVAIVIVAATIIGAVATFTTSIGTAYERFLQLIGRDGRARAIYRPLVDNLDNLDRAIHVLGGLDMRDDNSGSLGLALFQMVEAAAKPVCDARNSVSELGDTATRKELDTICIMVDTMKKIGEHTAWIGAVALAKVFDDRGTVKKLRESLLRRI